MSGKVVTVIEVDEHEYCEEGWVVDCCGVTGVGVIAGARLC